MEELVRRNNKEALVRQNNERTRLNPKANVVQPPPPKTTTNLTSKWGAVILVLLELVVVFLVLLIQFLRADFSLVPLFIFGVSWLHTFSPFCLLAAGLSDNDTFSYNGAAVLYGVLFPIDLLCGLLAVFYPNSFATEMHYYWVLTGQWALIALDIAVFIFLVVEMRKAVKASNDKYADDMALYGSEYRAGEAEWKPTRDVFRLKVRIRGLIRFRLGLWLLTALFHLLLLLVSFRRAWHLLGMIPYLWPTPLVGIIVGPAGTSVDPEPSIKNPKHPAFILSFILIVASIVSLCVGTLGFGSIGIATSSIEAINVIEVIVLCFGIFMAAMDVVLLIFLSSLEDKLRKQLPKPHDKSG